MVHVRYCFQPFLRLTRSTMKLKPDHSTLTAYFNVDNGSAQNPGASIFQGIMTCRIFESWNGAVP